MEHNKLIESLLAQLEQPTQLLQTHISWVILSGNYAYKIKKPINFGFIDYTDLEKRKHYCHLEITLNKRLAAPLYLGVIPISGTLNNPKMDGEGKPIEYAVKMRAFSQHQLFSNLITHHDLNIDHIESISETCAHFHQAAEICPNAILGTPDSVMAPVRDNFRVLASLPAGQPYVTQLKQIEDWVETSFQHLKPLLAERKANGFVRACHGDLHLGNMVLFENNPMIFDCIEFNESFRWTDVMNDVGFLAMDLEDKKRPDFASRFINRYLDFTHDYAGVELLSFYQSYRAMVRGKIAAIQLEQCEQDKNLETTLKNNLKSCIDLALSYTQQHKPQLILMHGVSGSGKTTYSNQLLQNTNIIRISSDIIRKHLFKLKPFEPSSADLKSILYSNDANDKVFNQLLEMTKKILMSHKTIIVDATFIKRSHRDFFVNLAKKLNIALKVYSFDVPESVLVERLKAREYSKTASDANIDTALQQLSILEPILPEEELMVEKITLN